MFGETNVLTADVCLWGVSIHVARIVHCRRACSEQNFDVATATLCFSSFFQQIVSLFLVAYHCYRLQHTFYLFVVSFSRQMHSRLHTHTHTHSLSFSPRSGVLNLKFLFARLVLYDYFHIRRFVVFLPLRRVSLSCTSGRRRVKERVTLAPPLFALSLCELRLCVVYAGTRVWG